MSEVITGTRKTLEANGTAITNNSIQVANDANYSISADGGSFPHAKFIASFAFSVAPVEGTVLAIYARPLDLVSTNDAQATEFTRQSVHIGYLTVDNVTTTQYAEFVAYDVPWNAEYALGNIGTGQSVSAGWTLEVIPFKISETA